MPWSLLLNPTVLLGIALALAIGTATIQTKRVESAKQEARTVQAQFDAFKAQVLENDRLAKAAAKAHELEDIRKAKEVDDEHRKRYSDLDSSYVKYRLRQRAGSSATERLVPTRPAGSSDDKICFDSREALDSRIRGALDGFRVQLATSVEPYDQATLMARTCRDWALR